MNFIRGGLDISIGCNYAQLLVNLFCYSYEAEIIRKLIQIVVKTLRSCIFTLNGYHQHLSATYIKTALTVLRKATEIHTIQVLQSPSRTCLTIGCVRLSKLNL